MIYLFLPWVIFFASIAEARVTQTQTVHAILSEVDDDTLVLFDIDNTTLTPSTALGSAAWFEHLKGKVAEVGLDKDLLVHDINKILRHAHHIPCEESLPELIRSLQERGVTLWGLTARLKSAAWDPHLDKTTQRHLLNIGVDFEKSLKPHKSTFDSKNPPPMFAYGVIFSSWTHKGPVLVDFLKQINYHPSKIIFIDDQPTFIESVEVALEKEKIPFVGFHYSGWESCLVDFDPFIANIQLFSLNLFGQIVTNAEAERLTLQILSFDPNIKPDFYLDMLLQAHLYNVEISPVYTIN